MRFSTQLTTLAVAVLITIAGCKKKTPEKETVYLTEPKSLASISTNPVDSISGGFAVCGGVVGSEGTSAVTAVGVCWDTKTAPTTLRPRTYEGAGTGSFRSVISGLQPGTTYYVRAYATNAHGTAYGNEVTFKTPSGWTRLSPIGTFYYFPSMISKGARLIATSNGSSFGSGSYSDNGGVSFSDATGSVFSPGMSLATFNNNIYMGTSGSGVYVSSDNGSSWAASNMGISNENINCLVSQGSTIFAGSAYSGVYRSNNGSSWSPANFGLNMTQIITLATNGTSIFAGTTGGLFVSTDNANSWTKVNSNLIPNLSIYCIAAINNKLFMGTQNGFFVSTDNGSNWNAVSNVVVSYPRIMVNGSNALLFDNNSNVYLSTDNGTTWTQNNFGLPFGIQSATAFGNSFIANSSGGIFKLTL